MWYMGRMAWSARHSTYTIIIAMIAAVVAIIIAVAITVAWGCLCGPCWQRAWWYVRPVV